MALIYHATLTPSKLELLSAWLPGRPWFTGSSDVERVAAYRFDDPAGEVGIETLLLRSDGDAVFQVPVTYRAGALPGAEGSLIGTCEHSVLGTRWVYDACADPVWAAAIVEAVVAGGTQAAEFVAAEGGLEPREHTATVAGSGAPGTPVGAVGTVRSRDESGTTVVRAGDHEIVLARVVGVSVAADHTLTGSWPGAGPAVLAGVRDVG